MQDPGLRPNHAIAHDGAGARGGASILAEITADVAGGGDIGALLQRFLEPIVRLAGAHAGAVRVLSDDDERLELVSAFGLPPAFVDAEQAVDRHCGHCGIAADGQPVLWSSDVRACAAMRGAAAFGDGRDHLLAVPLQHRGRVLGVYNLFFADAEEPAPRVQAILKSIGELLGLALNNARLEAEHLQAELTEERQQIAAEVHDSLAQGLAFVKLRLPLLEDALRAHDEARALQYCDELRRTVSEAHAELRSIIGHLRAPVDPQGLAHALQASAERFRREGGVALQLDNALPALRLEPAQEVQVARVVQEALTNIARHAQARHAWLQVAPTAEGGVEIVVDDDGIGPAGAARAAGAHYGLQIMRERAQRIGGRLDIEPRQGGGTRVRLQFAPG
ncbi:MAG: GAF domain-containing protein [Burkholderiales bacterium]|nr:GAF domain-containing protein [Burkholderiales bacterium]